jgi:hypothetical protein
MVEGEGVMTEVEGELLAGVAGLEGLEELTSIVIGELAAAGVMTWRVACVARTSASSDSLKSG